MKYGLTPRQRDALNFLRRYIDEHGYAPTYDEIKDALGVASKNAVFKAVNCLEQRGHIRRIKDAPRSITLLSAALCAVLLASGAGAHDIWIAHHDYRGPGGERCCGEQDCAPLADGDVEATAQGYWIKSLHEMVPFAEAQISEDGKYWRCFWGGKRHCFFAPPAGT